MIRLLEKIRIKNIKQLYGGFLGVCIVAMLSIVIFAVRGFADMETEWIISISADIFGICMCCIIYYGCMNGSDKVDNNNFLFRSIREQSQSGKNKIDGSTVLFATLIIVNVLGMFIDEICWCIQGLPSFRTLNKVANALFYTNNFTELCMFWGYSLHNLKMKQKTVRTVRTLFKLLYPSSIVINFLNIFIPIYFSVDANGVYQREPLFPISQAILIIVIQC